jgi:hypothetical protein
MVARVAHDLRLSFGLQICRPIDNHGSSIAQLTSSTRSTRSS